MEEMEASFCVDLNEVSNLAMLAPRWFATRVALAVLSLFISGGQSIDGDGRLQKSTTNAARHTTVAGAASHQAIALHNVTATRTNWRAQPGQRRSRWSHMRKIEAKIFTSPGCEGEAVNFSCRPVMQPSVWDQRSLLFVGDSNTRKLA